MKSRTFYLVLLLCILRIGIRAQVEGREPTGSTEIPDFYLDALSFASTDSLHSRLDVYIHVPYDVIRFIKSANVFKAEYEVTVDITTDDHATVAEKTWTEDVIQPSYEETEKRDSYNLTQRSLEVPPGTYMLRAQVHDNESKKTAVVTRKIVVGSYRSQGLNMSDIMLISHVTSDKGRLNIVPNISGNVADVVNGLYVFYEVYNTDGADSIESLYSISAMTGKRGEPVFTQRVLHRLSGKKTQVIEKLDTAQYSTGQYELTVTVKSLARPDLTGTQSAEKKKTFIAKWGNMPYSVADLDLAIRQLRYIAKDSEYNQLTDAKTMEEKKKLFEEFWRRRDPSPDTKRNEYMEEYYARVEYANAHFSHYLPGWRTDMGMVFILLGSPNNVERHPFDIDSKPYEVWSYYDYNRQLVFLDDTGFGDFKLLTPIYDLINRGK